MGYTLHFIPHTHWDREWYMSFEDHRFRLVEFMDTLLGVLKSDKNYKCFHLDGQIILLEDYLAVRPNKLDEIRKYVSEGRLHIGPWYVLQDEFLTSGEANIRNLLYGIRLAEKYGPVCMVGYFPDTFGSISQMPQILNGFGIEYAVIGRGVNPADDGKYKAEFLWQSQDGSEVTAVFLAEWYNNAAELPIEATKAREFLKAARDKAAAFSQSQHLLMMNGSDHQPLQKDISVILEELRKDAGEEIFLHSSFINFFDSIKPFRSKFHSVKGELTGQKSDGELTLVNTASSRMYLKQMNYEAQNLLEKWVEPLGSMAWLMGDTYRKEFIDKAWRYLLKNHPHDSICGCSIDDVHEEMVVRFKKSISISRNLINREAAYIASSIDTTAANEGDIPVVVFNPLGWRVSEQVSVNVDYDELDEINLEEMIAVDYAGNTTVCDVTGGQRVFSYELPDHAFRKVRYVNRFQVSFIAENIPPMGYKTYWLRKALNETCYTLVYGEAFAENKYLRLEIEKDGTLCLLDKTSGYTYPGLNILEDVGDIGDEYKFISPDGDKAILTKDQAAEISSWKSGKASVTFAIRHRMLLPECAYKEKRKRSAKMKEFSAISYVTLGALSRRIDITTEFNNQLTDHRIRAIFYLDIKAEYHWADGSFDVVQRDSKPGEHWKNPSNCQRQQAYVELFDGKKGLMIANRGLPEYEILRDGGNAIALTLLRAVGEMGDWGYFPTPGAQCLGKQIMEYSIIPYAKPEGRRSAHIQAHTFNTGSLIAKTTEIHPGKYKPEYSFLDNVGENVTISALKRSEDRESLVVRMYNHYETDVIFQFSAGKEFLDIYETNLNEERAKKLKVMEGFVKVEIPSKKIKTFEIIVKGKEEYS